MAAAVAGSMVRSKRVAMRTARSRRSLSSAKRAAGSPMARSTFAREVLLAADVVDEQVVERVEEHAVDGEVAAQGVLAGGGEDDRVGVPAVAVGDVGAEGGDLDLQQSRRRCAARAPR